MNLVVVPLEGVSQLLFWQYREAMPTLWGLFLSSMAFRRFYSSSTSSLQSHIDLFHGDTNQQDHNTAYGERDDCLAGTAENLWECLAANGHRIFGATRAAPVPCHAAKQFFGAWPAQRGDFQCFEEHEPFYGATEKFLRDCAEARAPFSLYYCDRATRLKDECAEKNGAVLLHARLERGFVALDKSVKRLLGMLAAKNLVQSTIVVVVGMYGVDFCQHGLNRGRIYGVEPYADSAWTPMFIYFNGQNIRTADQLVSLPDLKPTILKILFPDKPVQSAVNITQGVNVLEFSRLVAFSQNLFALERENYGPAAGLVKSYGVTDGDQRLMVTSNTGGAGSGGMELFYDLRDPGNTRNFLDFFQVGASGDIDRFEPPPGPLHSHFINSFKSESAASMLFAYNKMKMQLFEFVLLKESAALRRSGGKGKKNLFPRTVFRLKRGRR